MADKKGSFQNAGQLSLFDMLGVGALDGGCSAAELGAAIGKLVKARKQARQREAEEQERRKQEKAVHVQEVTCMELPLDWENAFDSDERARGVHTDSIPDALILSLTTLGKVDIEYISSVTGADYKTVIHTLKGAIYQNPDTWDECFYRGWETAEEYLSGNLMRKWRAAKQADQAYHGYFSDNVKAIETALPPAVATKDIYITLGSPWVPADVIDDFILHLFGDPFKSEYRCGIYRDSFKKNLLDSWATRHDEITGTWEIPEKSRYDHSVAVRKTYGTDRLEALHILEKTLNMKPVAVTEEIACTTNASGTKRVIDKAETAAALEKQRLLIQAFRDWVWSDENRKERLEIIFENNFSCVRRRIFDGSFLTFPGLSPDVALYPYQKDAVARILFTPNTLLAHDVGAGKTYIMIAAGQELRRMGLSQKNLYVVPNHIVGQWREIFARMYPDAKLLCVEPKSFTPQKREAVLKQIRDLDYDGIIMAYSCFELIPLSKEYYADELRRRKLDVERAVTQKGKATSRLKKKLETVDEALSKMECTLDELYDTVYFDELGITRLFVDEAHNFKNVPVETKTVGVLGVSGAGSKKCRDMMDKVHMVQRNNNGGGVVLATGTPITNSITDAFVFQQYLQSGELALLELQSFDSWIGMFAEKVTEFEIDVDTNAYRLATRFAKFHNLPELTSLLSAVADFHRADESADIPRFDGYRDAVLAKTPAFASYLDRISARAEDVRQGRVSKKDDNMLKITTDGRKAALDLRLVDPAAAFTPQSKVARCAENAAEIYFRTAENKSAQIVFCDSSTPKAGFNLYSELKTRLALLGVPEGTVAFVHDAETEAAKAALFAKVRRGDVRILIGSTFKLGIGVNIQERLIALHHLDVPWRPADMTQREGRILRQGNTNERVYIYRYITEGSFDAYSWQLLETKQRFISGLLSGSLSERSGADVEDTVLNYAEVKALAVGNQLVKLRVEAANELSRCMALQRKLVESRLRLETELLELPGQMETQHGAIDKCALDLAFCEEWKTAHPPATDTRARAAETEARRQLRELLAAGLGAHTLEAREKPLAAYRGFRIVLPANMAPEKPFVWLEKNGKYYVELGEASLGYLIRIDHCLNGLGERLETLKAGLASLRDRERDIKNELAKDESYTDRIEAYRKKVDELDRQLGVDKQ